MSYLTKQIKSNEHNQKTNLQQEYMNTRQTDSKNINGTKLSLLTSKLNNVSTNTRGTLKYNTK